MKETEDMMVYKGETGDKDLYEGDEEDKGHGAR